MGDLFFFKFPMVTSRLLTWALIISHGAIGLWYSIWRETCLCLIVVSIIPYTIVCVNFYQISVKHVIFTCHDKDDKCHQWTKRNLDNTRGWCRFAFFIMNCAWAHKFYFCSFIKTVAFGFVFFSFFLELALYTNIGT